MTIKMFISHSSSDIIFVERINQLLKTRFKNKIEAVISAQRKEIGTDIPKKIIDNIEECSWFLVLLTRSSITNPTVMHELGYANALLKPGIITRIIPIVERIREGSGKDVPIDTGVFFDRNIESAKYVADEAKWNKCISEIAEYLNNIYTKEMKPSFEVLEERAEQLSKYGYYWEAAEKNRTAAKELIMQGEIQKGIDNYRKAIESYIVAESNWEAAAQHSTIAKLLEKSGKYVEAAKEYRNRGDLLSEMEEYTWEAAKAFEKAGILYTKEHDLTNARIGYDKAILMFEQNDNDFEADSVRKRLRRLT